MLLQLKWIQHLVWKPVVCSLHHCPRNSTQMQRITKIQWDFCNSYFYPAGKWPLKSLKDKDIFNALTSTPHLCRLHMHQWALAKLTVQAAQLYCCYYTNPLLCEVHSKRAALYKAQLFPAVRCWIYQKKEKRKVGEFHYKCKNVYCCCCCTALHPTRDNSSLIKSWWMMDMARG